MRILREPAILAKMGLGKTKFEEDYIKTGRARWIRLGKRAKGLPEHEVDQLIAEAIAARDAAPFTPPTPAVPRDAMLKGARSTHKRRRRIE